MNRAPAPLRALCIDDEPDVLAVICAALRVGNQFQTHGVAGASEALAWLGNFRADVILLDVMMPAVDGIAAFREIRKIPACRATPVVFLSAAQLPELAWDGPGAPPRGCIGKPFDASRLARQLRQLID